MRSFFLPNWSPPDDPARPLPAEGRPWPSDDDDDNDSRSDMQRERARERIDRARRQWELEHGRLDHQFIILSYHCVIMSYYYHNIFS